MKPNISDMTLREKLGQTGMPGPSDVRKGVLECGGYIAYFSKYPYAGLYADDTAVKESGEKFSSPREMGETLRDTSRNISIPLLVTCDCELGAKWMFDQLHSISTNMALGAAQDGELAYKRSYYWAKELRSCGVNWAFGPVVDLQKNFLNPCGVRCIAGDYRISQNLIPYIVRGIQDAGIASCTKHFPGGSNDYRDAHFSADVNNVSMEEWRAQDANLWREAIQAGTLGIMTAHAAVPSIDSSLARADVVRPGSSSQKVVDVIRKELKFNGVIITDAVCMKSLAAAFNHEDVYIECFNAGNDIVLFCNNDYIDVMEKAVLDGRVSIERVDEACKRVLDLKEKLGLFDEITVGEELTLEENIDFDNTNYRLSKKALTLVANKKQMVPFDPQKVKKVAIINLAPYSGFLKELDNLSKAFTDRGIDTEVFEWLKSKKMLKEIAETCDMIIYACYLVQSKPYGMPCYSRHEDIQTLFNSLSYGATKSVVISFGAPSIYYNYFENADTYINAYSSDCGTMRAVADGLMGDFEFTGKSPVALRPEWV